MAEAKTKPTDASVAEYLTARASPEQLTDCKAIMAICSRATNLPEATPPLLGAGTGSVRRSSRMNT